MLEFKQNKNEVPLKNSLEWLSEFISFSKLHFECPSCTVSSVCKTNAPQITQASMLSSIEEIKTSIGNINKKINEISCDVNLMYTSEVRSDMRFDAVDHISSSINQAEKQSMSITKPKTYAGIVSEAVEIAVKHSLRSQKQAEQDSSSAVMYNLPEKGNDLSDVLAVMKAIKCTIPISKMYRVGKSGVNRPIRLFLSSSSDRDRALLHARTLKNCQGFAFVRMDQWLCRDEMERVKALREHCKTLNSTVERRSDGKKQYVVVSGRLMVQSDGGKLLPCKNNKPSSYEAVTTKSSSVRSSDAALQQVQPKNDKRGSQVTPSQQS
jgi:hypothetical protein